MDSIGARLYNAKLAAAVDNACSELPDNVEVIVNLSNGCAEVVLHNSTGGEAVFPSNRETLADTINDAVKYAVENVAL